MTTAQAIRRRDRWANWAVIALVAVALILGLIAISTLKLR